ncbi:hypothetical protein IVG45_09125 [Methylomonas sp. LL1]|uniref:hypothetical protein n=1 Tax=Methylomonas sp. LL1 TaxID=2785785 RepID=UPI0018C42BD6|nr:hypothetical protein [Methylomonas sp. LL1]QPK65074.1 hypothetical protein IVG45_09125 [Methylomonas sp. LL1]
MSISYIITAAIALITVLVTQYKLHKNTVLRENRSLLQKKSEEIAKLLFSNQYWLNEKRLNVLGITEDNHKKSNDCRTVAPIEEAIALQLLYFQELEEKINVIKKYHDECYVHILNRHSQLIEAVKQSEKLEGIKGEMNSTDSKEYICFNNYYESILPFIKESLIPSVPPNIDKNCFSIFRNFSKKR